MAEKHKMPIPTDHIPRLSILKAIRSLQARIKTLLPPKWLGISIGLLLLICGQLLMESLTTQGRDWVSLWEWGQRHHIGIINLENAVWGSLLIVAGGLVCASMCSLKKWEDTQANIEHAPKGTITGSSGYALPLILLAGLYALLIYLLAKHYYSPFLVIGWLFILAATAGLAWKQDRQAGRDLSPQITTQDSAWILLLLLIGIAIGAFFLEDIPNQLIPDEGSFWETARAIALRQHVPPIWGPGVYTFPIASSYFQGWLMRLFGVNLWGWRFSSVLFAILSAVPLYLLLRDWFDRRTAITACLLMFCNPYFLSFARLGYNNAQALLPLTLGLYFVSLAIRKSSLFYYFLTGLTSALAVFTYPAAWLGSVVILLTGLWMVLLRQKSFHQAFRAGLVVLGAWLLVTLPQVAYTLSGTTAHTLTFKIFETSFFNGFYARAIFGDANPELITTLIGKNEIVLSASLWRELLLRGTVRTLVAFFDPHLVSEHFMTTGLAGGWMGLFFVVGFLIALRRLKEPRFWILAIWMVSGTILLGILAAFPPRHTHLVAILPALAAFSAIGLSSVASTLTNEPHLQPKSKLHWWYTLVLLLLALAGLRQYLVVMPEKYHPGFEDIVSWNAWRNRAPAALYYIEDQPDVHKVAYLADRKLTTLSYHNLSTDVFLNSASKIIGLQPAIVFYPQDPDGQISRQLLQANLRFHTPIPFTDASGNIIGYGSTNIDGLSLQPEYHFRQGLMTLVQTPAIYLLVSLLVGLALIGWRKLSHHPFSGFEFELKIRVAFPKATDKSKNSPVEEHIQ